MVYRRLFRKTIFNTVKSRLEFEFAVPNYSQSFIESVSRKNGSVIVDWVSSSHVIILWMLWVSRARETRNDRLLFMLSVTNGWIGVDMTPVSFYWTCLLDSFTVGSLHDLCLLHHDYSLLLFKLTIRDFLMTTKWLRNRNMYI